MAKRKATTSRTTSSKTPQNILSQLNLSGTSVPAQSAAEAQQAEAVSNQRRTMPPTPPGAHAGYVPPSPRLRSVRLSRNISLSLNVKKRDERTNASFSQEHSLTFTTVVIPNAAVTTPRPQFNLPGATQPPNVLTLRPVFDWTTHYTATLSDASNLSSDDDVETESDIESESIYRANVDELKPEDSVELAVEEKTRVVDTDGEMKNNDDEYKTEVKETEKVNDKDN